MTKTPFPELFARSALRPQEELYARLVPNLFKREQIGSISLSLLLQQARAGHLLGLW